MTLSFKNVIIAGIFKIALLGIGTAHAAGSAAHSIEALDHSGAAASHGAAAVASGAATAVAVPMISAGSAAAASGAAIGGAGVSAMAVGSKIIEEVNKPLPLDAHELHLDTNADPAPRLD